MDNASSQGTWHSTVEDIEEETVIGFELSLMVDEGLLEMGVNEAGEAVFWPTAQGCTELGMES